MSANVGQILSEIEAFAPLGEKLAGLGLSAAGVSASNMQRIATLEAGFNQLLHFLGANFGGSVGIAPIAAKPAPASLVAGSPKPKRVPPPVAQKAPTPAPAPEAGNTTETA